MIRARGSRGNNFRLIARGVHTRRPAKAPSFQRLVHLQKNTLAIHLALWGTPLHLDMRRVHQQRNLAKLENANIHSNR
jgi:hypothetical protein